MIGPVMPELHLHGFGAARQTQQLVAKTDAEDRHVGLQEARNGAYGIVAGLGVTRPVTQENTVRIHCKYLICRSLCRHNRHAATVLREDAQNVALDAEVVGLYMHPALRSRRLAGGLPDEAIVPL